jgi:hypothetical protein
MGKLRWLRSTTRTANTTATRPRADVAVPERLETRPRQRLVELAFEHEFEEFANPIAQPGFDWVKPVVEKVLRRLVF